MSRDDAQHPVGPRTVLVTGAGALVGQGVLRCLNMVSGGATPSYRIVTADPERMAPGHWLGECGYRILMARDPRFLDRLREVVEESKADVLLVGTDAELEVLSKARASLEAATGVRVVVSSPRAVEIADDKLLTARFLEAEGFPFPVTADAADHEGVEGLVAQRGFPLLAKPRRGARSRGVSVVRDREDLARVRASEPGMLVQEYLPDDPGEYTAGCLVVDGRAAGTVVLRRDLRDGNTFRAYLEESGRYNAHIEAVAERLEIYGPCNFQFRVRGGEPVIFEINARFSGTTPLRAMFGFNEVDALLAHLFDGVPIPQPALRPGVVLRVWSDLFVGSEQFQELEARGRLDQPACQEYPFLGKPGSPA